MKRNVLKYFALFSIFMVVYGLEFLIQWGMWKFCLPSPDLAKLTGGQLIVCIPWQNLFLCVTENCVAYAAWAFVLAWLFDGFQMVFLSDTVKRRKWVAILVNFMYASLFCLQLLLTESVADSQLGSAWIGFIGTHMTGCVCILLLAAFLLILADKERRLVCYAFMTWLVYFAMLLATCLLPMSLVLFRIGLIVSMCIVFVVFIAIDITTGKWRPASTDNCFTRSPKLVRVIVYVFVIISYVAVIIFWQRFGRTSAFIQEERFLRGRAPCSIMALRTGIFTERDKMRSRLNDLVGSISNSWVDVGVELMSHPASYGADPVITNVLPTLARDEYGKFIRGDEALKDIAEPKEDNGEFQKKLLGIDGKLSDIKLSGEVVDRVTESARKRLRDPDCLPMNGFLICTHDKRKILCRVGRDTYESIKILEDNGRSNIMTNGMYGDAELNLDEIVAFSSVSEPEILINEQICIAVTLDTLKRMYGYVKGYNRFWEECFCCMIDAEIAEDYSKAFAESLLNEKEVEAIRHDFIDAINSKRGLSPSLFSVILRIITTTMTIITLLRFLSGFMGLKSRCSKWASRFHPMNKSGIVCMFLIIIICMLLTWQLSKYLSLWKQKRRDAESHKPSPDQE